MTSRRRSGGGSAGAACAKLISGRSAGNSTPSSHPAAVMIGEARAASRAGLKDAAFIAPLTALAKRVQGAPPVAKADRPATISRFPRLAAAPIRARLSGKETSYGQCRRRRRPVGRRGEGQDRGLAVGARRYRRALSGRSQRRSYVGHRRDDLQASRAAVRRGSRRQTFSHRQRCGPGPVAPVERN